ncbi:TPA: hypothetical protein QCU10_005811 [Bacillus anthracis]|nr:hypothetical protein [Bacillus cereus biovar anthracis]HDR6227691.1 hypothetical protein [Bacillus cereus biovar anthracis]HDR6230931.1 hypothetical protein [Bacillus cereus biovar anthracis]HDR6240458.1 hypothetical protein [Bacillus cereus biovar anthracis]HDR6252402.1 hypothetical protein [Bacillus cereus biovar anthracis]
MINKDFEKECMQARLDLAERQINQRLEYIERARIIHNDKDLCKVEEVNMYLLLSTITGKPNKFIEF